MTRTEGSKPAHGLRVLAVDDQPAQAEMVALMLAPLGHTVGSASSGEEALRCLECKPYDLVISDIGMGTGMDGWELAEHVKAHYPHVRFYLATGWGAQIDPQQALAKGVRGVISKPYRVAELHKLIAE